MKVSNISNCIQYFGANNFNNSANQTLFDDFKTKYSKKDIRWNELKGAVTYIDNNNKECIDKDSLRFMERCMQLPHCARGHNLSEILTVCHIGEGHRNSKIDKNALFFAEKMLEFGNNVNDVVMLLNVLKPDYHTIFDDGKFINANFHNEFYPRIRHYSKFDEELMSDILSDALSRNNPNFNWTKYSARDYIEIIGHCKQKNINHNKMDYNEFYRILALA